VNFRTAEQRCGNKADVLCLALYSQRQLKHHGLKGKIRGLMAAAVEPQATWGCA
jgi:hypothetical protein